jgi:hypothetical protein
VQQLLEAQEAHTPALVKEALGKVPLPLLTDKLCSSGTRVRGRNHSFAPRTKTAPTLALRRIRRS